MFLEKFEVGKRYRFNKELFIEHCKQDGDSEENIQFHLDAWADEIDNKFVNVIDENIGEVGWYNVTPRWCEEVVEGNDN